MESVLNLQCENNSEIEDLDSRLDVIENTYIDDLYREIKFLKARIIELEKEIKH
jgi:polyhydroxyalkanoate synthesis regulator phasin